MPAPGNNDFASATTISGGSGSTTGNNILATTQTGEPGHYNYNPGPAYPVARAIVGPFNTVWFKWVATATDYFYFSTRDLSGAMATDFRSTLQVFTGSAVGSLTRVTLVLDQSVGDGNGADNGASIVFKATSGTSYYFQIDSRASGATGNFILAWSGTTFPAAQLGDCVGNQAQFDPSLEECLGAVQITDITSDGYYSFGTFSARAGIFAVRSTSTKRLAAAYTDVPSSAFLFAAQSGIVVDGDFGSFVRWHDANQNSAQPYYPTGTYVSGYAYSYVNSLSPVPSRAAVAIADVPAFNFSPNGAGVGLGAGYGGDGPYWTIGTTLPPGTYQGYDPNVTYTTAHYEGNPSGYLTPSGTMLKHVPGNDDGVYWSALNTFALPADYCGEAAIPHHLAGMIGVVCYGDGTGTNTAQNPSYQLVYYPLTIDLLTNAGGFGITGSGTAWTISFGIKNLSSHTWDGTLVELLNTGGITGASGGNTVNLTGSATTNSGNFTCTADPASGLLTATIRISRNGVVVGTIDYPLYPIFAAAFTALNTGESTCSGLKYWRQVLTVTKLWPPNDMGAWGTAWTSGYLDCGSVPSKNICVMSFSVVGGPPPDMHAGGCTIVSAIDATRACYNTFTLTPNFKANSGASQTFNVQMTFDFKVGSSTSFSLPTFTATLTIPPA